MGVTVQHCHRVRRAGWRGASCFWEQPELLRRIKRVSICQGHEASEERRTTLGHLHQEKFFALFRFGDVRRNKRILRARGRIIMLDGDENYHERLEVGTPPLGETI